MENYMKLEIAAKSVNEGFARSAVAAFALPLSPSLSELSDIKTAVSEAVTNAIVHAYHGANGEDKIEIECKIFPTQDGGLLHIKITDFGCGIENVEQALKPFFTTLAGDERSGMGFTIMQTFSDGFAVTSEQGKGTIVTLTKRIGGEGGCNAEPYPLESVEREGVNA